jgi:hypothetical protein
MLRNAVIDWQVAGSREGVLAQTEGEHSDVCLKRVIPVTTFEHRTEAASWQLDVSAKTMYSSSSSDNEEFLGAVHCYKNYLCENIQCTQSVLKDIISDNTPMCIKS